MSNRIKLSLRVRPDVEAAPWVIEEIKKDEATIERLQAAMKTAHDHLMNLQPHIAQLPENCRPFIDTHVDLAMEALSTQEDSDE